VLGQKGNRHSHRRSRMNIVESLRKMAEKAKPSENQGLAPGWWNCGFGEGLPRFFAHPWFGYLDLSLVEPKQANALNKWFQKQATKLFEKGLIISQPWLPLEWAPKTFQAMPSVEKHAIHQSKLGARPVLVLHASDEEVTLFHRSRAGSNAKASMSLEENYFVWVRSFSVSEALVLIQAEQEGLEGSSHYGKALEVFLNDLTGVRDSLPTALQQIGRYLQRRAEANTTFEEVQRQTLRGLHYIISGALSWGGKDPESQMIQELGEHSYGILGQGCGPHPGEAPPMPPHFLSDLRRYDPEISPELAELIYYGAFDEAHYRY
jgi:hypothetical protein